VRSQDLAFEPLGEAILKGVAEPVRLFRARSSS
jgi:class 3 adenylate cyclase